MAKIDVWWIGLISSLIAAGLIASGINWHYGIIIGIGFPIYFCGLFLIKYSKRINYRIYKC